MDPLKCDVCGGIEGQSYFDIVMVSPNPSRANQLVCPKCQPTVIKSLEHCVAQMKQYLKRRQQALSE